MGFGSNGQGSAYEKVDWTVTGEGTQPLSDMNWKKRENKYLGQNSVSDKEVH